MSEKIRGAEFSLSKIFSSDFDYTIPSYQRPYAWTREEAGELWGDLYDFFVKTDVQDDYFLGSIVLIKEEGKPPAEVIDGQQRLTTLTILLAALAQVSDNSTSAHFRNYLCEPGNPLEGLEPKPRLRLRERDAGFFKKYVQDVHLDELSKEDPSQLNNESQRNIQGNASFFLERLRAEQGKDSDFAKKFGSFLVQRCFLVVVSTPSQQSAFRVFSVLNSRGLDLLPTDIIKSDVIGKMAPENREDFNDRWEDLEVSTGRDGFAEVFAHIRMIYALDKARRSLLEEFRERVLSETNSAEDLFDQVIEPYVKAYLTAKNSTYVSSQNASDVNDLLGWLNRIGNADWMPCAMLVLAKHSSETQGVLMFMQDLERLAAFMNVCGYNVTQRIARYVPVLAELREAKTLAKPIKALDLSESEKEQFRHYLQGNVYDMPNRRRNYLLLRLNAFMGGALPSPTALLTVEHVLPQTMSADWSKDWTAESHQKWVHRLGNLALLGRSRNLQAQNYNFERKKTAYFKGTKNVPDYSLTVSVLNVPEWTPEVVEQRQTELLGVLSENWCIS
ncbi:hypothetical protein CO614_02215 [Lysobacteraceae bacterium NML120232]|nr:hypothetical protein CO608_07080 [Xanthomonadaceae bacterium NML08-0793]PJK13204.1 hypothetical protein CO614_02215 [Xanthomonadaceae bacterium NML120232]